MVVLNFRFIDLESDNLCRYDFVDVYNGHANGQRIGRFCGTFRPGSLVASGNKMMVQMISDANTAGSGFMATFSAAAPDGKGTRFHTGAVTIMTADGGSWGFITYCVSGAVLGTLCFLLQSTIAVLKEARNANKLLRDHSAESVLFSKSVCILVKSQILNS